MFTMNKQDLLFFEQDLLSSSSSSSPSPPSSSPLPSLHAISPPLIPSLLHPCSYALPSLPPQPTTSSSLLSLPSSTAVVPKVPEDPFLVPRQYQEQLFEKALKGNVIAVMDTGSGKTLVAVMLIREMLSREKGVESFKDKDKDKKKMCFFVVNNVPLVFQQASVIRNNSSARVAELCGAMDVDMFSDAFWEKLFESADVVVLTAQILYDSLSHGFLHMSRMHLLIFDECHHARKNHPFEKIMSDFYKDQEHLAVEDRPKIFGMTASPTSDVGSKLHHSASELETTLDAKVFTVDRADMAKYVPRPVEAVIQFNSPPKYATTELTRKLQNECVAGARWVPDFESAAHHLGHLGPWCVDRLWKLHVDHMVHRAESNPLPEESKVAVRIASDWEFAPPRCVVEAMSPKVIKLVQILRVAAKELGNDFCGIIFVERRETAAALCLLLQELEEFDRVFSPEVLAGHGEEKEQVMRMSFREQASIISNFRNKVHNLLVATRVAEEGLDIQPCNIVIRFDPVNTAISYIQSRGRARQANSRYIIMQEVDNSAEEAALEKVRYGEKTMIAWCQALEPDRLMRNVMNDPEDMFDSLVPSQTYRVASTGALLTLDSAVASIHYYCSKLSGDEHCSLMPKFVITSEGSSGFVCDLTLPPNAPIRLLQSDRTSTKGLAKKSAAFKACERLHALGALNDNLLPIVEEKDTSEDGPLDKVADKGDKSQLYPANSPSFWDQTPCVGFPSVLYGNIITLSEGDYAFRTMGLLTRHPLPCSMPPLTLYVEGSIRTVVVARSSLPLVIDHSQISKLCQFTLILFHRMTRKNFECDVQEMPYFVAPMATTYKEGDEFGKSISWSDVDLGQDLEVQPFESKMEDAAILNRVLTISGRDYFVCRVLREFKVSDSIPKELFGPEDRLKGAPASPSPGDGDFGGYIERKLKVQAKEDDVLLLVQQVKRMRNHLQPAPLGEGAADEVSTAIAPLSACRQSSVYAGVLRISQLIPSTLFHLDSVLLVHEIRHNLGLDSIDLGLLQVALTTSSANRNYQYERLEWLGDSFLKFSSTIRLFIVNPAKNEGQLHLSRIRIISNAALRGHAEQRELYRYVSSTPFHRKSWRPTRFNVDGKPWSAEQQHRLSNKTLSDVIEATLGAAYLSGGVKLGLEAAKALGIPFDEFKDWNDFYPQYSQVQRGEEVIKVTESLLSDMKELEAVIGYKFKNPLLFVEAMAHASHIRTDSVCYQRLEFLGDAVLDFQVVRYYYKKYSQAPPGVVTLIKDASVSNSILGAIGIRWGVHRYLQHYSPTLIGAINRAVVLLEEREQKGEYWIDVNMPKVLGDLVESTLGAVFVDSQFSFEVVSDMFERLFQPFLDEHVDISSIVIHPNKVLLEKLQKMGCNDFAFKSDNTAPKLRSTTSILRKMGLGPKEKELTQKTVFKIHGQIIATAMGSEGDDLRKEVAVETLRLLQERPDMLRDICTCPKRRGARHVSVLDKYQGERLSRIVGDGGSGGGHSISGDDSAGNGEGTTAAAAAVSGAAIQSRPDVAKSAARSLADLLGDALPMSSNMLLATKTAVA